MKILSKIVLLVTVLLIISACKEEEKRVLTPEEIKYSEQIAHIREQHNIYMKTNPNSPFNYKGKVEFYPLNYFEPDMRYIYNSKLYQYDTKDTVVVFGTKGEEREFVRYGYFNIEHENEVYKLNVYQGYEEEIGVYYSVWFTDETTNDETYGVGRYLNVRIVNDPENTYTIDFNAAYNPYCAYSKEYSCAIPRKEDHIGFAIKAGEKKFHD
ncbi:MAG: DUF1684 domain-containing protein [Ignavibacteriales bacterium]|jgi:uncharacterized protein (DUF1684 family)|nr:MAG: DUF1684 domain-containing protein [Ignavibacteriales bacterium]